MVVGAFFGAGLLLIVMFYTLYRTVFKPFRELRNIDNGGGMIKIHDIKLDDEVKLVEADSQRNIDVNDIKGKNASKVDTMDAGGARFGVGALPKFSSLPLTHTFSTNTLLIFSIPNHLFS